MFPEFPSVQIITNISRCFERCANRKKQTKKDLIILTNYFQDTSCFEHIMVLSIFTDILETIKSNQDPIRYMESMGIPTNVELVDLPSDFYPWSPETLIIHILMYTNNDWTCLDLNHLLNLFI